MLQLGRRKNIYRGNNGRARYSIENNKYFLNCIAAYQIMKENKLSINEFFNSPEAIENVSKRTIDLFDKYCEAFNLDDVDKARVHVNLIRSFERLFGYRINLYSVKTDGKNTIKFDIIAPSQSRYVYNNKASLTMLLYEKHYYLVFNVDRIMNGRFSCFDQ